MKTAISLLYGWILLSSMAAFGQHSSAFKHMRKAWRYDRRIDRMEKHDHESVTEINYYNYADDIFPNDRIMQFKHLRAIHISGRSIRNFKHDSAKVAIHLKIDLRRLKELSDLRYISLSQFDMTTFPAELYELENVQALTITACLIDSLPIGIAHLGHLRRLDLRLNYLRSLPSDFSALDSLEELDLMNNHLRVIPPQLKSLKAIRLIDLGNDRTGHDREGTELEYASYGIDWPFPLCANHISWDDSIPELIRLLSNSTLLRLKLFARQCGDKQRSFQLIGSQPLWNKIHWEKPNPCPDPWPDRWIDRPPVANKDLLDKDICKCSLLHY